MRHLVRYIIIAILLTRLEVNLCNLFKIIYLPAILQFHCVRKSNGESFGE